jgi:hypothetical protein
LLPTYLLLSKINQESDEASKLEASWPDDFGFFAIVSLFVQTLPEWETSKFSLVGAAIRYATAVIERAEKNSVNGISSFSPSTMGSGALVQHRRRQRAVSFESQGGDNSPWPFGIDETSCASWASTHRDETLDSADVSMPISPAGSGVGDEAAKSVGTMSPALSRRAATLEAVCRPLFACLCLVDLLHKAIKSDDAVLSGKNADATTATVDDVAVSSATLGGSDKAENDSKGDVAMDDKKDEEVCERLKTVLSDETFALGKLEGALGSFLEAIGGATSKALPSTVELAGAMNVNADTLTRLVQVAMEGPRE